MGMSAWGLLAAPFMATSPAPAATAIQEPVAIASEPSGEADLFGDLTAMDENAMGDASGGADTAIDIGVIGINLAENEGVVRNVDADNSTTGQIANNYVANNAGITTVYNNTGNGVIFQSTVNVNIYTDPSGF